MKSYLKYGFLTLIVFAFLFNLFLFLRNRIVFLSVFNEGIQEDYLRFLFIFLNVALFSIDVFLIVKLYRDADVQKRERYISRILFVPFYKVYYILHKFKS